MLPVRRRLFTLSSVLSLLLFVAVCVLWVRSYWRFDSGPVARGASWYLVAESNAGSVILIHGRGRLPWNARTWQSLAAQRPAQPGSLGGMWGFALVWMGSGSVYAMLPHWFVALVAGVVSFCCWCTACFRGWRGRGSAGLCITCGYDLRASPDRCSECGAANPARAAALTSA